VSVYIDTHTHTYTHIHTHTHTSRVGMYGIAIAIFVNVVYSDIFTNMYADMYVYTDMIYRYISEYI